MPLVTFNVDPNADPAPSSAGCSPGTATLGTSHSGSDDGSQQPKWKEGQAERIKSLEAMLSASKRRRLKTQQQSHPEETKVDYSQMLASEDEGEDEDEVEDDGRVADSNESGNESDDSSDFYGEGQPLLQTYQPPTAPGAVCNGAAAYGAIRLQAPRKTADQYLPWSVRLRRAVSSLCFCCTTAQSSADEAA